MINMFHLKRNPSRRAAVVASSPIVKRGRIVFATFEPGRVVIDLLLQAQPEALPSPIALEAVLPHSTWAAAAAGVLDRWATTGYGVELRFRGSKNNPRVQMTDGTYCTLLDLSQAPDLPPDPAPADRRGAPAVTR